MLLAVRLAVADPFSLSTFATCGSSGGGQPAVGETNTGSANASCSIKNTLPDGQSPTGFDDIFVNASATAGFGSLQFDVYAYGTLTSSII